ncbi:MAG: hypothetical protein H6618_04920 [Deltaproteobacteria bacterium]|nr:hypothetical protein [Deltaproteobacteria bacterium]
MCCETALEHPMDVAARCGHQNAAELLRFFLCSRQISSCFPGKNGVWQSGDPGQLYVPAFRKTQKRHLSAATFYTSGSDSDRLACKLLILPESVFCVNSPGSRTKY